MPSKRTAQKAYAKKRQGYATTTAAGEFVREEMHHKEQGRHGRESRKQAIATGLAKARRAGLDVPPNPNERPRKRSSAKRTSAGRPKRAASRKKR